MYQVRDGQRVAPTCKICGCRLLETNGELTHYYGDTTRDARGCICVDYYAVLTQNAKLDKSTIVVV